MNKLTSYREVLQASVSELSIRTDQKLSRHERSMLRLYIARYKALVDDPYALYADSLHPGRALSNRTRRAASDPALAAPYGETGPVHGEERAVQKARRLALSCGAMFRAPRLPSVGEHVRVLTFATSGPRHLTCVVTHSSRALQRGRRGTFTIDDGQRGTFTAERVRSGADFAAGVDYSVVEERVLAHMQHAAPWRRSKRPTICRICDGAPGNDGPYLCGFKAYGP